jgi:hypothetical protein
MRANPEPKDAAADVCTQCPMVNANPHGPEAAYLFEM